MAKSFGVSTDQANELVQQMYVRIEKYVEDKNKILYNDNELNTFYVYVTLRNLYLSGFHSIEDMNGRIRVASQEVDIPFEEHDMEVEYKFNALINKIDSITDNWYWYDKKLWRIYFYWKESMRKIAKESTISLSSIFNTLKHGKEKIKNEVQSEYEDYRESRQN